MLSFCSTACAFWFAPDQKKIGQHATLHHLAPTPHPHPQSAPRSVAAAPGISFFSARSASSSVFTTKSTFAPPHRRLHRARIAVERQRRSSPQCSRRPPFRSPRSPRRSTAPAPRPNLHARRPALHTRGASPTGSRWRSQLCIHFPPIRRSPATNPSQGFSTIKASQSSIRRSSPAPDA